MICDNCGRAGIEWKGPLSNLMHTECPHCGGTNCQRVAPDNEDDLPDGLIYNDGQIQFECISCGAWTEWCGDVADFEPGAHENMCGGSPRCCP